MSKYAIEKARKAAVLAKYKEDRKRWLKRNHVAVKFCLSHKLSVYPAIQPNNRLKVFIQHHEKFLPESERMYDPESHKDMVEMYALIDREYEKFYEKHKKRGLGKFYPRKEGESVCETKEPTVTAI